MKMILQSGREFKRNKYIKCFFFIIFITLTLDDGLPSFLLTFIVHIVAHHAIRHVGG